MDNSQIADMFSRMAMLLEFKGEDPFKVKAYNNAARNIKRLDEELFHMYGKGNIEDINGIGKALEDKIIQMLEKGTFKAYEKVAEEIPEGIMEIMDIPGIGPKQARLFYEKLGISSVDGLVKAAGEHRIRKLPRMGPKQEENILRSAIRYQQHNSRGRHTIAFAMKMAEEIREALCSAEFIENVVIAGSLRRKKETVGDIDLIAVSSDPEKVVSFFTGMEKVEDVLVTGTHKASIIYSCNTMGSINIDLRVIDGHFLGSMLQYLTGSKEHNIHLRKLALLKGYSLSEYGFTDQGTDKSVSCKREEDVYRLLGLEYIPAEIREDLGEIEASQSGNLPALVKKEDIRGDLHIHSNWSDGTVGIENIVQAAVQRGYEYIAITDHSPSTVIANGLSEKRLFEHVNEIRCIQEEYDNIRILSGTECDILADGKLDYSNGVLEELDIVIAAVHAGQNLNREKMTRRIVAALENEHVDILAHPTGRKFGRRAAYDLDVDKIFAVAKDNEKALEINSSPWRLDLNDINAKKAKENGLKIAINTDAHTIEHFDNIGFGIDVARRGWLGPDDIINCMGMKELCTWLGIHK